jgi:hypothetical protein
MRLTTLTILALLLATPASAGGDVPAANQAALCSFLGYPAEDCVIQYSHEGRKRVKGWLDLLVDEDAGPLAPGVTSWRDVAGSVSLRTHRGTAAALTVRPTFSELDLVFLGAHPEHLLHLIPPPDVAAAFLELYNGHGLPVVTKTKKTRVTDHAGDDAPTALHLRVEVRFACEYQQERCRE